MEMLAKSDTRNTSAGVFLGCALRGSHWMGRCCCVDRFIVGPCDLSKVSICEPHDAGRMYSHSRLERRKAATQC